MGRFGSCFRRKRNGRQQRMVVVQAKSKYGWNSETDSEEIQFLLGKIKRGEKRKLLENSYLSTRNK